jgi:hypothetical protein
VGEVIKFPSRPGTPEHWVDANPEVFFVVEGDPQKRRCYSCNKTIRPRQRYFGAYEMRCHRGDPLDWYTTGCVKFRFHPDCAPGKRG